MLHLLSNIVTLPVTKSNVKDSGMGKAIGSIEKHTMCLGTPNEASIKERVIMVKGAWQKSVKLLKEKNGDVETSSGLDSGSMGTSSKRELETTSKLDLAPAAKKSRTDEKKKSSSLLSLLNKVKPDSDMSQNISTKSGLSASTATGGANDGKFSVLNNQALSSTPLTLRRPEDSDKKKQKMRVKWQDHFGGELTLSKTIEGDETKVEEPAPEGDVSWSDRKKRDRLREKELLSKVK